MKKALFIISGKAKYIPDLIHIHIQDHGKLINGEFGGLIIVCEFFNRSLQVFYLGYQIVVTEFSAVSVPRWHEGSHCGYDHASRYRFSPVGLSL